MEKRQHCQLALPECSPEQHREWIFQDVASDITIYVDGEAFALHKFPLVSRSGRIRKLVAEHRDFGISKLELIGLPGGAESFELAAKFCYGVNFEITSTNVAYIYCVSSYLDMTEEFSKNNLCSRAEEYIECVICKSLELCVKVLQQCENLLPFADDLKIVNRCIDSIASKACTDQIASSFSRLEFSSGRLNMNRHNSSAGDWWTENLSSLSICIYERVITAMKFRGVRPESIGASLVNYAHKNLTKICSFSGSNGNEKIVVEMIVTLLPVEKLATSFSFLFGLLKSAVAFECSISSKLNLERRIGSQLDFASLDDLLIPSFRHSGDTLFDVDTVHRILLNFSQYDDTEESIDDASIFDSDSPHSPSQSVLFKVSNLVDNYLAEVAPDLNLQLGKFIAIADALPSHSRTAHDGLYRAIDIYLKAHQDLSEVEKKRLCKLIDFEKLSHEAGSHAAQNERLPVQSMVQVLYFQQLKLQNALFGPYPHADHKPIHQSWRISSGVLSASMSPRDNYASLRRENRELKLELARLRMRLNDLEKEHVSMKRDMEKSNSHKFLSSFSKNIGKFNFLSHKSLKGPSSPFKQSQRTDPIVKQRT